MLKSVLIFSLALTVSLFSYAQELKDGRYTSSNKLLDVVVIIRDGQINSVNIEKHRGGGDVYLSQLTPLLQKIVDKQTTNVDSVTGATASSKALKDAVNDCLKQATISK